MHCIVGLGNPGDEYKMTRHNAGRRIVETIGGTTWRTDKHAQALVAEGASMAYVLPETFMNRSGETVRYFAEKQGIPANNFIIIHDEVDLPLGTWKISKGRGGGGHNGVQSVLAAANDAVRIRIGISPTSFWTGNVKRPTAGGPLEKFVLGRFSSRELAKIDALVPEITDAIAEIVANGSEAAMNRFN